MIAPTTNFEAVPYEAAPPPPPDGLALPHDFDARYGEGLHTGLSLGGGGLFFVAWQVTYLQEMADRGIDLAGADRVVGTSAGSIVSSVLEAGHLGRLHKELGVLSKLPKLLGALAPAGDLHPSQERARDQFGLAADAEPDTIRAIGHAALAARAPGPTVMPRNVALILGTRKWPSPTLHITCVDAFTAERCVVTHRSRVRVNRAVAASSAVPGLFTPQPILDRRCMDGGVSGTGTHLDLLAGAHKAVVLALTDGAGATEGMMTMAPGGPERELQALRDSGTEVFLRIPERMDPLTLMDPAAVPEAVEMARRQADADAEELRSFWV
ncbi:patatin-like phospholipase family protein [Rhabdothermincola salaria]|uniref:patatin-like phospholipase family protein n=1 Tax=Rhabdothermincola salaria TaxID=2903142 RepID=UPI001E4055EA|nr:patatin-like phospholipase family protein [Rhabdothermincola salaria]MCD9624367.1 patatin-like phospholipase family protein [Rhabdothermincola salaria]